ncbi:CoA-binding protein [Iodidimonas sp. SYSU 1G8]|uniref:CoA-binding protein n=1 Tax=Iodidimonas sp. SYSU 1G8 TaxID=3133967 RepID=UPI0031FF0AB2
MAFTNPTDSAIATILKNTRTIAVVGAGTDRFKPVYGVMSFLIAQGYDVYPVNPVAAGETVQGKTILSDLGDVPVPIDMVDCFRRSEFIPPIVDRAIEVGAKTIWMQLGVINDAAAETARAAGLTVVMDRCPVIEWSRLGL